jgi:RHS repeat-associated protein
MRASVAYGMALSSIWRIEIDLRQTADYDYDFCTYGKGRLCGVNNPGAAVSYAYTLTGELASESTVIEGQGYSVQHGYDVHGRRNLTAYPGGVEVSYGYDTASWVNALQAKVGGTWRNVATGVSYDAAGRMTALTHGNGIGRSVSYDWDGRVTAIAGSLSPQSLSYAWNAGDMITGITNNAYSSLSQTFAYDALSRLTGVTSTSGNHVISYDANGNRTTHTWGGATDSYSVSSTGNRLNGISATGTRARTYAHDAAGNRTAETIAGNTITHVYDGFARPASRTQPAMTIQQSHGATVSLPAGTWSYGHDGMGRRTFKRAPGNVLTRYLHGAEGGLAGETSPGGTTLTSIYLWLNGQPLGLVRGGQVYHVHADHLGRPEILTNASKAIVWRAENLAFDRKVATTSIGEYNLGFPGQYYDAEGASWQNWFRTYDGSVGRYTQSDPIGLAGGLNTYSYAVSNPLHATDPSGLGPVAFGVCTAVNAILTVRSVLTISSDARNQESELLQNQIAHIDREIRACDSSDNKKLAELYKVRKDLVRGLPREAANVASSNLGNQSTVAAAKAAFFEAGCMLLLLPVIPLP